MGQLKVMIDQFVSEGVLIPDISCSHASPLAIMHKKEGGIRMAVDYCEVNKFLRRVVFPPLNKRDLSSYIQRRENNRMITIKQL